MAQKLSRKEKIARRLLLFFLAVAAIGVGLLAHWMYFRVNEVRIAVTNPNGEDAAILGAVNDWLTSERRRFRLKLVPTGSPAASLEQLRARKVEVASLRADRVEGQGASSIMVLFNEVAGVMVPEGSPVKSWTDLQTRTIGTPRGTAPDDPLLLALLRLNGVPSPRTLSLETEAVREAVDRKRVQAIGFVSAIPGYASRNFRAYLGSKGAEPTFLGVDDPDQLAAKDKRFSPATIVAGSLRATPAAPDEAVGTLAIGRVLLVRNEMNSFIVASLVRTLLDARRALFGAQPLFAQAGSPDVEADAFVKVHNAAKKIYNGDEPSWTDMALEWVYIIPMIVGALGSIGLWIFQRYVHPEYRDPSALVSELLDVRADALESETDDELRKLRLRIDAIAEEIDSEAYHYAGMEETGAVLTAMLIAENQLRERRIELKLASSARQGADQKGAHQKGAQEDSMPDEDDEAACAPLGGPETGGPKTGRPEAEPGARDMQTPGSMSGRKLI